MPLAERNTRTHAHTHTHTHAHTHAHTHTHTHTRTQTRTHTRTHGRTDRRTECTDARTHGGMHAHARTRIPGTHTPQAGSRDTADLRARCPQYLHAGYVRFMHLDTCIPLVRGACVAPAFAKGPCLRKVAVCRVCTCPPSQPGAERTGVGAPAGSAGAGICRSGGSLKAWPSFRSLCRIAEYL